MSTHAIPMTFADGETSVRVDVRPCGEHQLDVAWPGRSLAVHYAHADDRLHIAAEGNTFAATVIATGEDRYVFVPGARRHLHYIDPLAHAAEVDEHGGHLAAPMSGAVVAVMVKTGDTVTKGAPLIVLEAMKMEHTITATMDGVIRAVHFGVGDRVAEGADLVELGDA